MAANFQITHYRYEDGIHLKLYGDFDGSSAHELLNILRVKSDDTLKTYIHTDGIKQLHPFGISTFIKGLRITNGSADRIVFIGKEAPNLDFLLYDLSL